jgi:rhodanese-related sulfurtransferase
MSLPMVSPQDAKSLLDDGATLIDIREADEHARERIACGFHLPLFRLDDVKLAAHDGPGGSFLLPERHAHAQQSSPCCQDRRLLRRLHFAGTLLGLFGLAVVPCYSAWCRRRPDRRRRNGILRTGAPASPHAVEPKCFSSDGALTVEALSAQRA